LAKAEAERRLRALAPTPQDFPGPALDARLAMKQGAGRLAQDWSEMARAAAQTRAELSAFKDTNQLRRAARYPPLDNAASGAAAGCRVRITL
jgi:hypothetical protein